MERDYMVSESTHGTGDLPRHASPLQLGGGVKNIRKVFAGGIKNFYFSGGSRNFEVKIKIA